MFSSQPYKSRREQLRKKVGSGLIIIPGNTHCSNNYPNNAYYFRQDSSFLYYFGLNVPTLVGVLDIESGEDALFGDDFTVEDIIWTGPQPALKDLAVGAAIEHTYPLNHLNEVVKRAKEQGRKIHYLPPYRGETKIFLSSLLNIPIAQLHASKSLDLMFAVAEMREIKSVEEIEAMERAFHIGYAMHTTAMSMCREGVVEREIAGRMEGITKSMGLGVSFPSIVSQHGETLHNLNCEGVLTAGRLLLCDAGGESVDNYCSDHTRTYPVSGRFTDIQKQIYDIVLKAHDEVVPYMKAEQMYHKVNDKALTILAEGLRGVGLIKGSAEDAVAAGAMYLFMPHGLSHGLGMDVHDCEAFGERSFDYSAILDRAKQSATCCYRATWRLRKGTVMSDEPGIYFIPALIDKSRAEGLYKGIVDYDLLEKFKNFGGIRIEDDIEVTENGGRVIGDKKIPITTAELEEVVGK